MPIRMPPPPPRKKKRATGGKSPTQRALAECLALGWTAQIVERWNQWARRRIDLFGVIDIVVITGSGILGVQVTSGSNHSSHRDKILAEPRAKAWVEAGGQLELWSYSKRGARGKRKTWELRIETYAEMERTR